jgi:hypothetical protein
LAFSYWFDSTLVSQLREDLLLCSSYLPLGVPNELYLQAISLLGDAEYDYDADPYLLQQVSYWLPPPLEEEEDEVMDALVLPVEAYQPSNLSGVEAL